MSVCGFGNGVRIPTADVSGVGAMRALLGPAGVLLKDRERETGLIVESILCYQFNGKGRTGNGRTLGKSHALGTPL